MFLCLCQNWFIPQSKLVINTYGRNSDKVVVIVELVDGWEVSVPLALDWPVRFRVSIEQNLGILVLYHIAACSPCLSLSIAA